MTAVSALRESFKRVLAGDFQRQREMIERHITGTALNIRNETDRMVPYVDHAVELWNSHADAIDDKYGERGFFNVRLRRVNAHTFQFMALPRLTTLFVPLRAITSQEEPNDWWARASNILTILMATDPKPAYQWMADVLLTVSIPEETIKHQARGRDGFWNRVLRKRKWAIAQQRAVAMREINLDIKEDQRTQRVRSERRDIMVRHEKLERLIREAPGNGDITVGWPHGWRVSPTDPKGTGMFAPLSRRQAQNVPGKDEDDDGGKVDPETE